MKYQIYGEKLPIVTLQFEAGESIYTQSGGMTWMTDNFSMETNMRGGLMKGLGRMLSGESLFMVTYTAKASGAELTIASSSFDREVLDAIKELTKIGEMATPKIIADHLGAYKGQVGLSLANLLNNNKVKKLPKQGVLQPYDVV